MNATIDPLPYVEINPVTTPIASVIWLHGLGADGNDFVSIVPELNLPKELAVRFVFPHAPMRPVTINNGYRMRAWYDIQSLGANISEDEKGIQESAYLIDQLIDAEIARGISAERIVLAGFSQGGAMALYCGLRYAKKLAGIIGLSTYLPLAKNFSQGVKTTQKIFMAHGTSDTMVPLMFGQAAKDFLVQLGYEVEFHTYPMPHSVCSDEILDIAEWLKIILCFKFKY